MAVGFSVGFLLYLVGTGSFLNSFFSTVCYHLENGAWGDKYPYLMDHLYQGKLKWEDVGQARMELQDVRTRLQQLPPSDVIWDLEDLDARPPWGDDISSDITDLSNYFVMSDGRDLIAVLFEVFDKAEERRMEIEILSV